MVAPQPIRRFSIYLVQLEPTVGVKMRKTRPCVVVSPDVMHRYVRTVIVAPFTSEPKEYPTRVPSRFEGRRGEIALDQLRAVDQTRLRKLIGQLDAPTARSVKARLVEMFS